MPRVGEGWGGSNCCGPNITSLPYGRCQCCRTPLRRVPNLARRQISARRWGIEHLGRHQWVKSHWSKTRKRHPCSWHKSLWRESWSHWWLVCVGRPCELGSSPCGLGWRRGQRRGCSADPSWGLVWGEVGMIIDGWSVRLRTVLRLRVGVLR